jgi:hypothetical protein
MTIARLRRLQRLEARQPRDRPWTDPYQAIMALWPNLQAVVAGKACWRPRPESAEPWPEETEDVFDRLVAEFDRMAERLTKAG